MYETTIFFYFDYFSLLFYATFSKTDPPWRNRWSFIMYQIALELILEGAIEYSEDGKKTIATAGTLFIIVPHSNVKIVNANNNQIRRKLELLICGNAPGCIIQTLGLPTFASGPILWMKVMMLS